MRGCYSLHRRGIHTFMYLLFTHLSSFLTNEDSITIDSTGGKNVHEKYSPDADIQSLPF